MAKSSLARGLAATGPRRSFPVTPNAVLGAATGGFSDLAPLASQRREVLSCLRWHSCTYMVSFLVVLVEQWMALVYHVV